MIKGKIEAILDILNIKFGVEDLHDIKDRLEDINDIEFLYYLKNQAKKVGSFDEFINLI